MTTFQVVLLVIFGVVGFMTVLVMYQMWKTLKAVERVLTVEIQKVADELRAGIEDARRTVQEATRLVGSLEQNFGHMNSTFVRLGDSVLKVAEIFQAPWVKILGYFNEAMGFVKSWKEGRSTGSGTKRKK